DLRLKFFSRKYRVFRAEISDVMEQINTLDNKGDVANAEIVNLQEKRDGLQNSMNTLVSGLEEAQIKLTNLDAKILNTDDKISFNKKSIEEFNSQKSRHERQVDDLKSKILGAENGTSGYIANLEEIKDGISLKSLSLSVKESELEKHLFEYNALQQKIDENKENVIDILHRESALQNETGSLSAERDTILHRRVKLLQRQETVSYELERIECERQNLVEQRDDVLNSIESLESHSSQIKERLEGLHIEIETINETINSKQQFRSRRESRLEILDDLERRYEGVGTGVKNILEEGKKEDSEITGICGMVADLIRVDHSFVSAIEAVLGDKAQIIVTVSLKDAIQAIDFLKEQGKGYARFLPLDHIKQKETVLKGQQNASSIIGKAVDLVKVQETFSPIVEFFFCNTIIVEDLSTALTYANNTDGVRYVASMAGEVVQPGGTILVGKSHMQIGLISRKMELESIKSELEKIKNEIEMHVRQKEAKSRERATLTKEVNDLTQEIDSRNILKASHESDLQNRKFKVVELQDEQGVNESEIYEINALVEDLNEREDKLRDEIKSFNDQRKDLERQVEISDGAKAEKESFKSQLQQEITEIKVTMAQMEERRDNIIIALEKLKGELQKSREELTSSYDEIKHCHNKVAGGEDEIARLGSFIEGLKSEKVSLEKHIKSLKLTQNELVEQTTDTNRQIEEQSREQRNHEQKISSLRLKENGYKIKLAGLEERIREDYNVELSQLGAENLEQDDESVDCDSISIEIEQLKGKVERMGSVNLEAIQELEELETREAHLLHQREDLETSENTLKDIIKKINFTSRELFEKTFNNIKNNFREIFRKLFGGGKANIILEEGVDILDAGIDIVAQPPGKELSSITLFSGGEKVMTTIALLFAIFQAKPSPFCILDEVDAALDENNINRFAMILKEFTDLSDFLVITHNKQTMSVGDIIYGVTMEEAGISKKISVKLKEDVKQVA
ncbi:MAG: chromosome segregation protein SMC, partial [Planctomycetes bacterium]|nr:chromosome segregation protein SMC [Planctomycetota bacterium]